MIVLRWRREARRCVHYANRWRDPVDLGQRVLVALTKVNVAPAICATLSR
jgi:hypothetical protein